MYSYRRDERTWWDNQRESTVDNSSLMGRFEPLSDKNGCATVEVRHSQSEQKRKHSAGFSPDQLRYHPSERGRMKEIRGYQAATLLRNYKLPLIFRKPVCGDPNSPRDRGLNLPPITDGPAGHTMERKAWRDPLAKYSKVVSIPPVERRMIVPNMRSRPALEAKGTKAQAHAKSEEALDKRRTKPLITD